ncbi:MAG: hypothetical protein GC151_16100 [Betaproteobacteria bacterium]|nr:hypothetical protein [Betaproteobacteria bacterium]
MKIGHAQVHPTTARQPAALFPTHAARWVDSSPRQLAQRARIAASFGADAIAQFTGHKPRKGDTIRFPATGPKDGDPFVVQDVHDDGWMKVLDGKKKVRTDIAWTDDNVWLVYQADPKDTDMRMKNEEWASLSGAKKTEVYDRAKSAARDKIIAAVEGSMVNKTGKTKLKQEVVLAQFAQTRTGEWQMRWNEINDREWQFTIDMDKPLAESWQEPHVGWEAKLIAAGANNGGKAYEGFAKQQGHIWLNDVPEYRQ